MPSPCEVVPGTPDPAAVMQIDGFDRPSRGVPHRVFPAIAGGVFAGLLLVGLGCTPFFQPQGVKAAAEQPTIVQAERSAGASASDAAPLIVGGADRISAQVVTGDSAHDAIRAPTSMASGASAIASSSSSRGGMIVGPTSISSTDSHRFTINCEPAHEGDDAIAARPERVLLQGIMASNASKAALLDGVLYREGDRFGAVHCPWTVAVIDAGSVRIEKTFGDRVCGVTIRMTNDKPQPAASATAKQMPTPRAAATTSRSR